MSASARPADFPCIVPYDAQTRSHWLDLRVPLEEYHERVARVRLEMAAQQLDALLVVGNGGDPSSILYLSNFTPRIGTTWLLLPLDGDPVILCDGLLHGEPMHSMLWNTWIADLRPAWHRPGKAPGTLAQVLAGAVADHGLTSSRIGVASPATISSAHADALRRELPQVNWVDGTAALLRPRAIKSANEIAFMRRACEITAQGLTTAERACRPGATEQEVANQAHAAMFAAGAEELGFDTAVSSGPRAGLKHAPPTSRAIAAGEFVFLDMGAVIGGYHADMSRCVVVEPADIHARRMMEASHAVFEDALAAIRPGNSVRDIYRAAEEAAAREGFADDYMPNGLGHGLGLSLIELPFLGAEDETILEAGMIFALEPMLVRYGVGTAVIEETVLVTRSGAETLSGKPW